MLTIPPSPVRRRRGRAVTFGAPPPSVPNEITYWGEAHSGGDFQIRLTVQGTATAIDAPAGFEVYDGDAWWPMASANLSALPLLTLTFGHDVTGAYQWRVPDAGAWHFADGGPMVGPLEGEFT